MSPKKEKKPAQQPKTGYCKNNKIKPVDCQKLTDRQLIRCALNNIVAEAALVELWNRYKKRLYLYIQYKIIRKPSPNPEQDQYVIEDVLQNVFTDVLSCLHQYNSHYEVSTWIYTVTNKHIMRYIREVNKTNLRTVDLEDSTVYKQHTPHTETPQSKCEAHEFESILIRFIHTLKKRVDQDVFILFIQNLNTHNISEFVGKTNNSTRARISRIMEKFRRYLKRHYPEYYNTHIVSYMKDLDFSRLDYHPAKPSIYTEAIKG